MRATPVKPTKSLTVRFMKIKTLVVLKVMDYPNLVISLFSYDTEFIKVLIKFSRINRYVAP